MMEVPFGNCVIGINLRNLSQSMTSSMRQAQVDQPVGTKSGGTFQHTNNRPTRGTKYSKISEYRFVHVQLDAKPIIKALTIPGTTQFFQWEPVSKGKLMHRRFTCFCARCIHNAPGACRNTPFCGDWEHVQVKEDENV